MEKNYRTEVLACLGDPVDANPTGAVEEAAFAACNLNWRFLMLRVPEGQLEKALAGAKAMGFRGLGVTMPHKQAIVPLLDDLTPAARIIGAVNAVYVKDGRWIGDNVDGKGFVGALPEQGNELTDARVCILGAGGAASAIAVECALAGAKSVTVINRTQEKGQALAQRIRENTQAESEYLPWVPGMVIPKGCDVLVNATCIGLAPDSSQQPDIDYTSITETMLVCDVVFAPENTQFLRQARKQGARTVSGIGMLVAQAALAFTGWTGMDAPVDVMDKAMRQALE